jgi:hypothetical protein
MRAFVQRSLAFAILSLAAGLSGPVLAAQPESPQAPEDIEEIVVIGGKTLSQWRLELEQAHDDLLMRFNEANEGKDTDVRCRDEAPTGSRIPQRVCWSTAQDRATASAARRFLNALTFGAGSAAEGAETGIGSAQIAQKAGESAAAQFQEEWKRVLGADPRFAEAVAEYAELEAEFNRLSGRPSVQQPRQIVLGQAGPQCEASTYTEYFQRGDLALVSGSVSISACPAGTSGSFTLVARIRDEAGATTSVEFTETWQRADTQDHIFNSDYPLGENVILESLRVRNLTCTCADPTQ